jgi:hypothetical protein
MDIRRPSDPKVVLVICRPSSVVLPVRNRARTSPEPALQRHTTPVGRLGGAAVARGAFRKADSYRYAILDRDSIFDAAVMAFLKGQRAGTETQEYPGTLAKCNGGALDRKCRGDLLDYVPGKNASAFPSEPQRLPGFQVAHQRQELLLLADVFSILAPHSGHFNRYTSMCTVVVKRLHGESRTARSFAS